VSRPGLKHRVLNTGFETKTAARAAVFSCPRFDQLGVNYTLQENKPPMETTAVYPCTRYWGTRHSRLGTIYFFPSTAALHFPYNSSKCVA
jgi:hypothetical protein